MEKDLEYAYIEFHNRASNLFFSIFRDFKASIEKVDRKKNEHIFRQQHEKYVTDLRQQLNVLAKEIITKNRSCWNVGQLSQHLNYLIADYTHRFVQKIAAL